MQSVSRRPLGPGSRSLEAVGRWLLLGVALTGLLAMHGLSDHGTATTDASTIAGAAAPVTGDLEARALMTAAANKHVRHLSGEHAAHSGDLTTAAPGTDPHGDGSGGHGDHHASSAAACFAVLVAAFLLRAAAWRRRHLTRLRKWTLTPAAAVAATAWRARSRDPAAPHLTRLSISRC